MGYSEALEKQIGMRDVYVQPGAAEWFARQMLERGGAISEIPADRRDEAIKQFTAAVEFPLSFGETYYVAPEILRIVREMAVSLPDWSYRPELVPSQTGFVWLSEPVAMPGDEEGRRQGLRALGWTTVFKIDGRRITYTQPVPAGDEEALTVCFYLEAHSRFPAPMTVVHFRPRESIFAEAEAEIKAADPERMQAKLRLFGALMAFLEQPFVITPKERAERSTRRRLGPSMPDPEPLVNVVRLRRPRVAKALGDEHVEVEWSHRWVVSGHWRNQWYPTLEEHRPIWVLPYVKGPEDKPLRSPRAKVFAVVR